VLRPRINLALHFEPIANFDDQRRFIAYAAILQLVLRSAQQALDSGGCAMKKKDRISEREDQDRIERLLKIAFNTQLQPLKSLKTATKKRRALKKKAA
jgi:hypothetical protein